MKTWHRARPTLGCLILAGLLVVTGCSKGEEADTEGAREVPPTETPAAEPAPPAGDSGESRIDSATPETDDARGEEPLGESEPPQPPTTVVESPPPSSDPAIEDSPASDIPPADPKPIDEPKDTPDSAPELGARVADTKPGLTRIGATKCKMCHKIQYESWAGSKHASLQPALDCESCHGSGSEYKKKSIMEDPELAKAAGLVMPDGTFCVRCHRSDWQDEMLNRSHAHKTDESG